MSSSFLNYYRCPEEFAKFGYAQELGQTPGYFHFGKQITCFGRSAAPAAGMPNGNLPDVFPLMQAGENEVMLPFDADEILENLRKERYVGAEQTLSFARQLVRKTYYVSRPFLSVGVRKHFQRFHLRERRNIAFPAWPIDKTVDNLCAD